MVSRRPNLNNPGAWLASMIETPPPGDFESNVLVTPELAKAMLERNTHNRPVSDSTVKYYAELIESGKWVFTGVPIIFDEKGRLLDGQQRLEAVVKANIAVPFDLRFNIPIAAFMAVDTGKKRQACDALAISGEQYATPLAAAAKLLARWEEGAFNKRSHAAIHARLSNMAILQLVKSNPGLRQSVFRARGLYSQYRAVYSPSVMAFCHYLFSRKDKAAADDFFRQIEFGDDSKAKGSPINALRFRMARYVSEKDAPTTPPREQIGLIIKAWNAWRHGDSTVRLILGPKEAMPVPDQFTANGNGNGNGEATEQPIRTKRNVTGRRPRVPVETPVYSQAKMKDNGRKTTTA